jgi:hypothetical protein
MTLRCRACGDVVGVYEPARWVLPDGAVVEESVAHLLYAQDDVQERAEAVYHAACAPDLGQA